MAKEAIKVHMYVGRREPLPGRTMLVSPVQSHGAYAAIRGLQVQQESDQSGALSTALSNAEGHLEERGQTTDEWREILIDRGWTPNEATALARAEWERMSAIAYIIEAEQEYERILLSARVWAARCQTMYWLGLLFTGLTLVVGAGIVWAYVALPEGFSEQGVSPSFFQLILYLPGALPIALALAILYCAAQYFHVDRMSQ